MRLDQFIARGPEGPLANGRKSLPANNAPVSLQGYWNGLGIAAFGAVFAIMGVVMAGVTANLGGHTISSGSPVVLRGAGMLCFSVGLFAVAFGLRFVLRERRAGRSAAAHPGCPARSDFFWDPEGSRQPRWNAVIGAGAAAVIVGMFAAVIDLVVIEDKGTMPVLAMVILAGVNLLGLFVLAGFVWALARALRFAPGWLRWKSFPVARGETAEFVWSPPRPDLSWSGGRAILRGIEEVKEEMWRGKSRNTRWAHYVCVEIERQIPPGGGTEIELAFEIPADAPKTCLSCGDPAHFWELEITLEVPGINPHERHLVPVY